MEKKYFRLDLSFYQTPGAHPSLHLQIFNQFPLFVIILLDEKSIEDPTFSTLL